MLTAQELAVSSLVAAGLTNREIAGRLVVSVKTVEYHLGNTFRTLDLTTRHALIARYYALGIAPCDSAG